MYKPLIHLYLADKCDDRCVYGKTDSFSCRCICQNDSAGSYCGTSIADGHSLVCLHCSLLFIIDDKYYLAVASVRNMGAGRRSEVERSLMVRWVVGSILHGMDPLSYFSFQPVLHNWCNKGWYVLSCLWDGAYKRTIAANRKE